MSRGSSSTTSRTPRVRVPRHVTRLIAWLVVDYFAYAAHTGALARRVARRRLLRPRRASECLSTSCGMTRASSSTTSPTPRVRVPRHVARLVVDYFAHAARPGDSARHVARRRLLLPRRASRCLGTSRGSSSTTSRRTAHRRLLHLSRAYGCLGTSRGSSSTSSPTPRVRVPWNVTRHVVWIVVDYFAYAARSGASARHADRRRLFHLRRVSVCPGTSRGSLLTSSPTPRVQVPRHVVRLVIDYFASRRLVVD
jgi:hypothetical protein